MAFVFALIYKKGDISGVTFLHYNISIYTVPIKSKVPGGTDPPPVATYLAVGGATHKSER